METIAASVVETALSAAFDAIFKKLSSEDVLKYARRKNMEAEVNQWEKSLRKIELVLDDAEEKQMSKGPIKMWLDDLRDLAYDVEDILDEFSTEVMRKKVMADTEPSSSKVRKLINTTRSRFNPRDIKFNVSLGSKMKEISERFERITKEKDDLRLTERVTGESSGVVRKRLVETTSFVPQVFGRKKDKETLINELLSSDANGKPVVAIVGMGGMGKTTLAQLVYNDETVSKSFDIKAWVCVSDEFDVFNITVKITEGFTKSPCDMKDLNSVQSKLKEALHKKKFLLILDDVWNEDYMKWDALSLPLLAGGLGSRVLITTRNDNVAFTAGTDAVFMHRLKKLEGKECLSLLALHAFAVDNFSRHPSLKEIGEQIAKKCDGLPLAAKALGGLLRGKSNPREWRTVLDSNMWELTQEGKCPVLPALRVSYLYLPSHLKRCFGYCAIFPKDNEFEKDDLIMWWMAQGFLEQSKNVCSNFMEVGNEYFNDLLSRSFFQPSTSYDDGPRFVMHDLMNDLAMWISGGICLHLPFFEESNDNIEFEKLRHLSFMGRAFEVAKRFDKFSSSMKLRSFIVLSKCNYYLSNSIFEKVIGKMKCLKLLSLRGYKIKELPHSISELKQLRHLDMSHTEIRLLPESVCDLLNLQVLKLNGCKNLIQLPQKIRKFINLRLLDISKTPKLKEMPLGICRLTKLQILTKFIVGGKHGLQLKELQELSLLGEELSIWGLDKVVDIQYARDINLKAKVNLVSLEFKWMEETSALEKEKQVQILDELQPHSSLKSLEIAGYNGKCLSKWIGHSSFVNLETLCLLDCRSVSLLPPLGGLMLLKMLKISNMHKVKNVGKEFLGNASNSFPSLHTLILYGMNALEEWSSGLGSGEEARVEFTQLQKLDIRDCPMLAGKLPNQLPLLGELSIGGCPNLTNLECTHHSLRTLIVEDCSELTLKTLTKLNSLVKLELKNIRELNYLDDGLVSMLGELQELEIERCKELKTLVRNGKGIEELVGLKTLIIIECDELEELVAAGETGVSYYFPSLEELEIRGCDKLVSFGAMRLPSSLKRMRISNCPALKSLPEGYMIDGSSTIESALEKLTITSCPSLTTLPKGRFPDHLVHLEIRGCITNEYSEWLAGQNLPQGLTNLIIEKCEKVVESLLDGGLKSLASLIQLNIDGNGMNIKHEAPIILPSLRSLYICDFGNLESLAAFQLPSSLEQLWINDCPKLRELPIHELSSNLGCLFILNCPMLKKRCRNRKGEYWLKLSIIPFFWIDDELNEVDKLLML